MRKRPCRGKRRATACLALGVLCFLGIWWIWSSRIGPTAVSLAEHYSRLRAEEAVTAGVEEVLEGLTEEMVEILRDQTGNIQAVEVNMAAINRMKTRITQQIAENLGRETGAELAIPLGTLLGGCFLSGRGPAFHYRFLSAGSMSVRIVSRFEDAGINQTRHQLILAVQTEVEAVLAGKRTEVSVPSEFVLAETVLVGQIPESYTRVLTDSRELVSELNDYAAE